jgi:hypothetical protein
VAACTTVVGEKVWLDGLAPAGSSRNVYARVTLPLDQLMSTRMSTNGSLSGWFERTVAT